MLFGGLSMTPVRPRKYAYSARGAGMKPNTCDGNSRSGRYLQPALTQALEQQRLKAVEDAFASLPARYLGTPPGFHASYRIELDDLGLSWAVELDEEGCEVTVSPERGPDVVIGTDAATWLELREGQLSGLDAFRSRRLWARGNLDLAVAFEGFLSCRTDGPRCFASTRSRPARRGSRR